MKTTLQRPRFAQVYRASRPEWPAVVIVVYALVAALFAVLAYGTPPGFFRWMWILFSGMATGLSLRVAFSKPRAGGSNER